MTVLDTIDTLFNDEQMAETCQNAPDGILLSDDDVLILNAGVPFQDHLAFTPDTFFCELGINIH